MEFHLRNIERLLQPAFCLFSLFCEETVDQRVFCSPPPPLDSRARSQECQRVHNHYRSWLQNTIQSHSQTLTTGLDYKIRPKLPQSLQVSSTNPQTLTTTITTVLAQTSTTIFLLGLDYTIIYNLRPWLPVSTTHSYTNHKPLDLNYGYRLYNRQTQTFRPQLPQALLWSNKQMTKILHLTTPMPPLPKLTPPTPALCSTLCCVTAQCIARVWTSRERRLPASTCWSSQWQTTFSGNTVSQRSLQLLQEKFFLSR
jgi:hypothetical protein